MKNVNGGAEFVRALLRARGACVVTRVAMVVLAIGLAMSLAVDAARAGPPSAMVSARELAAPPEDITSGVVAAPPQPVWRSNHAMVPFDRGSKGGIVRVGVPRPTTLSLVPLVPAGWELWVEAPDGSIVVETGLVQSRTTPFVGEVRRYEGDIGRLLGTDAIPVVRLDIEALRGGVWTVECRPRAGAGPRPAAGTLPPMLLVADGRDDVVLAARPRSLRVAVGEPVEIDLAIPAAMRDATVEADIVDEAGHPVAHAFEGDPLQPTLRFTPLRGGVHIISIRAKTVGPMPQHRSIEEAVSAVEIAPRLSGRVAITPLGMPGAEEGPRSTIRLGLDRSCPSGIFAAAEVWHVAGGIARPVAWIGGLSAEDDGAAPSAILAFDRRWLGRAGVEGGTLELRNARLHDRRTWGLLDRIDVIPLGPSPASLPAPEDLSELLLGRPGGQPLPLTTAVPASAEDAAPPGSHALLIVHGYCSGGVTFPPSQFTGPVGVLFDPNQAKSNDEFAQTLLTYGAQFRSYGAVCHSQGGNASLHLYTFYWSGFDWARPNQGGGNRLIQSVGSPYQGTPLAGNLAVLGEIFGAGCGTVTDLTTSGASTWLSTIPTWARARVWYWTTSFLNVPFQYDYCDLVTDFFLTDPEDGVVEKTKGQLPGATNMGHTEGWCHIEDMRDPPQCTDATRNAQMNGAAAR